MRRQQSSWGREFMWANEVAYEGGTEGWLSRDAIPDPDEAITLALAEVQSMRGGEIRREQIQLRPVLMREIGEVDCRIRGMDCESAWVECTARARKYERFWRVEFLG